MLAGRVGRDAAGATDVAALRALGVDVRLAVDEALPTGVCVTIVEPGGERTFLPDRGANAALTPDDLPADAFAAGGHLHLSAYPLLDAGTPAEAAARAALALAARSAMTVSVDPASSGPLRALGTDAFLALVHGVGTLLPNADELLVLTGEAEIERAARGLVTAAGVGEVVVTLGAGGALWTDGEGVVRAAAPRLPAGTPVDSTGAGDAFTAGWLMARRGGAPVGEALRLACGQGARVAGRPGARP